MDRDADEFVREAYRHVLLREADPGGLVNYLAQLRAGMSRRAVLLSLASSAEGREKSVQGAISQSAATPSGAVNGIVPEPQTLVARTWGELVSRDGERFVRTAYQTLLGRDPDPEGLHYNLSALRAGVAKPTLLARLHGSHEYRDRQAASRARLREASAPGIDEGNDAELEEFVRLALEVLFGPLPDARLVNYHLAEARKHLDRSKVLELIRSTESARRRAALVRRVRTEALKNVLASLPVLGVILRALFGLEGNSPMEQRIRRLEYMVGAMARPDVAGMAGDWYTAAAADAEPRLAQSLPASESGDAEYDIPSAGARGSPDLEPARRASRPQSASAALRTLPAPSQWK